MNSNDLCDEVMITLRRIVRAIELQSRQLMRTHGLTGPQIFILKALMQLGDSTVGRLAEQVSLSKPTVTDILNRLERQGLVSRVRSEEDKRCVWVTVTDLAREKLDDAPQLLQKSFADEFNSLKKWEQLQLVSALHKLAAMTDAEQIDPAPLLEDEPFSSGDNVSTLELKHTKRSKNLKNRAQERFKDTAS